MWHLPDGSQLRDVSVLGVFDDWRPILQDHSFRADRRALFQNLPERLPLAAANVHHERGIICNKVCIFGNPDHIYQKSFSFKSAFQL